MKKVALYLVLLTFSIVGCVNTNVTMLSNKQYSPITPEEVTIYLDFDDIQGEFEKVAIISVSGDADWTSVSQMFKAARKRAAKIGANGILYSRFDEPGTLAQVAATIVGTGTTRRGEMVAIFVRHK